MLQYLLLGSSLTSLFWDVSVLCFGYAYPSQYDSLDKVRERERKREIMKIALGASVAAGWLAAVPLSAKIALIPGWTGTLVKLSTPYFFFFPLYLGFGFDLGAFNRFLTTGRSRFSTGIIDELVEGSREAVLDYQRLLFAGMGIVISSTIYLTSKYILRLI